MAKDDDIEEAARILPEQTPPKRTRPLGLFAGVFDVGPEFFEPLPEEELRLWNGEGDDDRTEFEVSSQSEVDLPNES